MVNDSYIFLVVNEFETQYNEYDGRPDITYTEVVEAFSSLDSAIDCAKNQYDEFKNIPRESDEDWWGHKVYGCTYIERVEFSFDDDTNVTYDSNEQFKHLLVKSIDRWDYQRTKYDLNCGEDSERIFLIDGKLMIEDDNNGNSK